jgi:outer membrane usher protein
VPSWISFKRIVVLALALAPRVVSGEEALPDPHADQVQLLEVQVNGQPTGKIGEFTLRDGRLMAKPDELRDLGILVPASIPLQPGGLIVLSDLPGVRCNIDLKNQELYITASESSLIPTVLTPAGRQTAEGHRTVESGTGMTLNYDVLSTFGSGQAGSTGFFDMRAFSPRGIVSNGWLAYAGSSSAGSGTNTAVRLDSAYSFADVNTLRRYTVGDYITGGLSWTRPVHLAGFQLRSDFSTRPDLVTFPMPSISGSAAVPSTVNVLADGNLVLSNPVAAGPFQVPELPVITGAGNISMTVTNALGQQVNVTQSFYANASMLAPGLHTFAVQSGWVRRNWGSVSNDYGKIAGVGLFRVGITPRFTLETTAEGTPGAEMAGAGGLVQIANLGVLNFAMAGSNGDGQAGGQVSAGAQRIGRLFSIGADATLATRNYRDIAAVNGGGIPRKQLSGFTSLSLRRFGNAGFAYAGVDQDPPHSGLIPFSALSAQHSKVVSISYSLVIHHMAVYAAEFNDFASAAGSGGLQVGLTIPFGKRSSVNISASSDGNVQLQAEQPAALVGQWGYEAYAAAGSSNHQFAQVEYKSPVGLFSAGIDQDQGQVTARMESQGAMSLVDRALFPSNEIYDSFAIVDTGPMPHVHVYQENRDVGITNSSGRLLVPDMRSFDVNHIAISATDIPADATIDNASRVMRPQDRAGVVVRFPIVISHGALVRLIDASGAPVALGSVATLTSTGVAAPVGYDGEAYIEGLSTYNELTIENPDGRHCSLKFDYHPAPGDIPSIGPLRCAWK